MWLDLQIFPFFNILHISCESPCPRFTWNLIKLDNLLMMHGHFKTPKQALRRQHSFDPARSSVNLSLSLIYDKDFGQLQKIISDISYIRTRLYIFINIKLKYIISLLSLLQNVWPLLPPSPWLASSDLDEIRVEAFLIACAMRLANITILCLVMLFIDKV